MRRTTRKDWIANIEDAACKVNERLGSSTVEFVFGKYGASGVENLPEANFADVWDELSLMAEDD